MDEVANHIEALANNKLPRKPPLEIGRTLGLLPAERGKRDIVPKLKQGKF